MIAAPRREHVVADHAKTRAQEVAGHRRTHDAESDDAYRWFHLKLKVQRAKFEVSSNFGFGRVSVVIAVVFRDGDWRVEQGAETIGGQHRSFGTRVLDTS